MSYTPNGIYFEEESGSPEIELSAEMVGAQRTFLCNWSDWQLFAYELVGFWRIVGLTPVFTTPIYFPGAPFMIATNVRVTPFDTHSPQANPYVDIGGDTNVYKVARLAVTYKTMPSNRDKDGNPNVPNGTILHYEDDLGADVQTVPGRTFHWGSDTTKKLPADMQPGIIVPTGNYSLTWDRVIAPPWTAIRAARGKLNATTFCGSPPGTVMFLGAQDRRKFQFDDSPIAGFWEMKYGFSENIKTLKDGTTQVGWNYLHTDKPIPANGESWCIVNDNNGNPPYQSYDFNQLFQFEITPSMIGS